ncbi:MAG: hypothetical protein AAB630_01845 [Patescibacteria group bacterium]
MLSEQFINALKIVAKRMEGNDITWAVIGSGALVLQGIDVKPNDLVISVSVHDLEKIHGLFADHSAAEVKEIETLSGKQAWDVLATIEGVETQFCGEQETNEKALWFNRVVASLTNDVEVDGMRIPCISLPAAIEAYKELHRPQKVELIQSFLEK